MRSVVLALAMLLCLGCTQGTARDPAEAKVWFIANRAKLETAYRLLANCAPRRADGYNVVWTNGESGGSNEEIRCNNLNKSSLENLISVLKDLGLIGATYYNETGGASFVTQRSGTITAGSLSEFVYDSAETRCSKFRTADEAGDGEQVTSLTGPPCNWHYRTNFY